MTTREPRFTEQDTAELLALALMREGLCPACGGPLEECTSHERTGPKFTASFVRCRRRDAISLAQNAKERDRPEALVWRSTMIRR